ncbi:Ankyrin repeat domain-containing protein 61 [Diaporthe eres]|uniref:Ankyrin repeat domain-containing protein 61 n=1 Tax=Diaporthe eres TaxID=83184 RepID=A0ABR1PDE1_DIAER
MTETSEQLFYVLDQQAIREREHTPVLYFSFDENDIARNTLKDMLATFVVQMICHNAKLFKRWGQVLFVQLNEEHGWTDQDLLQWFSFYSEISFSRSAYLVIDRFDECPKGGRDSFVEWLHQRMNTKDTAWKVAVTSRRAVSLTQGREGWRDIDLAIVIASDERLNTDIQFLDTTKSKNILSRYRPELLNDDAWLQSANRISSGDTLIQSIILEHSMSIPEWPRKLSMEEVFNLVENEDSGDELLMKILDSIFRKLEDQFPVRTMLKWILYSARPLSLWEFVSVMYPESLENPHARPEPESVRAFEQICEARLRGVIEIRDATVRLRNPRLRALLTRTPSASSAYLWNDIDATRAAYEITEACLQFLGRTNVQQELESIFKQATLEEHTYVPVSGYTNFCSYAAYYWPRHAALVPAEMGLSSLMDVYKQTAMTSAWLKAYWSLENPVTRSKQPVASVDSLLAGLGLPHSDIGTWDSRSIGFATQIAAARGRHKMAQKLLHRCEQSDATLLDVLIAAASSGKEELVLHIFRHIKKTLGAGSETFKWPPCLLYRAAWLGMDKFARALLEAGCSPEPGGPMAGKTPVSPLHQATRHGHIATMEVLLSHGADTGFKSLHNRSVLFTATYSVRPGVFRTLFEKGKVSLTEVDAFDDTALAFAAFFGRSAAIKSLLEIGADPHDDKDLTSSDIGWLPLVDCSARGHIKSVRILLDSDADPNQPGPWGVNTALRYAVVNSHLHVVRALLEKGADPNHHLLEQPILMDLVGKANITATMKMDLIKLLALFGARIDAADEQGKTALMHAIEAGVESVVACLLELGASVDTEDDCKRRPLHLAAEKGSETILELILTKKPNLDCLDTWGRTALSRAVEFPNLAPTLSTARVLIQHRKRFNIDKQNKWKATPLHDAIQYSESAELAKLLIDSGANLNLDNEAGDTPLALAAFLGKVEAVKILLNEEDCNKGLVSPRGMSAVHRAAGWNENLDIIKLLLESGADANQVGSIVDGSPLQTACENVIAGKEMIEYLLEHGADLHAQAGSTGFAISAAAKYGTPEIINLLLQRGATVNVVDALGRSPIHVSCVGGTLNFQEIYKAGGNHNLRGKDNLGRTVFHWAAQHGVPEVLEDLVTELGTDLINEPDVDGWTPLLSACWPGELKGADSGSDKNDNEPAQRQVRVFRILLENGARPDITGRIGDSVWSLRDVALFNKIDRRCLQQVEDALTSNAVQPVVLPETMDSKKGHIGALRNFTCNACYYDIRGLEYICSRDVIHESLCERTEWEQKDPVFEEEEVPVTPESKGEADESGDEDEDSNSSLSSESESDAES